jgi:hypothetical protein
MGRVDELFYHINSDKFPSMDRSISRLGGLICRFCSGLGEVVALVRQDILDLVQRLIPSWNLIRRSRGAGGSDSLLLAC